MWPTLTVRFSYHKGRVFHRSQPVGSRQSSTLPMQLLLLAAAVRAEQTRRSCRRALEVKGVESERADVVALGELAELEGHGHVPIESNGGLSGLATYACSIKTPSRPRQAPQ